MEIELYHQFLFSVARSPTIIQYIFLYSTISTFRTGHSTHTNNEHQTTEGNRPQRLQAGLEEEGGEGEAQFSHSTVGLNSSTHSSNYYTLSTHFQTLSTHYLTYTHCLQYRLPTHYLHYLHTLHTIYTLSELNTIHTIYTLSKHYQSDEEEGLFMCYTDPSRNISVGDTKAEMEVMARNQAGAAGASHVTCHVSRVTSHV